MIIEQKENIVSFESIKAKVHLSEVGRWKEGEKVEERMEILIFSFYIVRSLEIVSKMNGIRNRH